MKVGIYNRWLTTAGGGERHMLAIAEALCHTHQVELITHRPVDKEWLASKLHIDLKGVCIRVVPSMPNDRLTELTSEYDLFINASHMSLLPSKAPKSAMLVYFPTPISLSTWGRFKRWVGLHLRKWLALPEYRWGFYDPEMTSGGILHRMGRQGVVRLPVPVGRKKLSCHLILGLPDDFSQARVRVRVAGHTKGEWAVSVQNRWCKASLTIEAPDRRGSAVELVFDVDEEQVEEKKGKTEWTEPAVWLGIYPQHFRYYLYERIFEQWLPEWGLRLLAIPEYLLESVLDSYDLIFANSLFTQEWIWRYWHRKSEVLYPPVELDMFRPLPKRAQILTVGRFFAGSHNKKHLAMVRAFRELVDGELEGWEFHLAGGLTPGVAHQNYLERVQKAAQGYPIFIHTDVPFAELVRLYGESAIYWHASGYGERVEKNPILFEHFGITTVEAMAAGCVPVVIGKAGQKEIVQRGVNGYLWDSLEELKRYTLDLIADPEARGRLAERARVRSRAFGRDEFQRNLRGLLARLNVEC